MILNLFLGRRANDEKLQPTAPTHPLISFALSPHRAGELSDGVSVHFLSPGQRAPLAAARLAALDPEGEQLVHHEGAEVGFRLARTAPLSLPTRDLLKAYAVAEEER